MDSSGSEQGLVVDFCEGGNVTLGSIQCGILCFQLKNCSIDKKDSDLCNF